MVCGSVGGKHLVCEGVGGKQWVSGCLRIKQCVHEKQLEASNGYLEVQEASS